MVGLRLIGAFAAIILNLILARNLGADQLAAAWSTVSMAIVATIFLTLGVDAASVRVISRRLAVDDLTEVKGFTDFSMRLTNVLGVLWLVGFWAAALHFAASTEEYLAERLLFIGAVAPIMANLRVLSSHTLADGRPIPASFPQLLLLQVLQLTGVFLATLLFPQFNLLMFMGIYVVCIVSVTVLQWRLVQPLRSRVSRVKPDFTMRRDWMITGGFLAVPALLTDFSRDIISALSVTVLTSQDVAILAIALKLTAFLRFGVVAINQVFMSRLGAAIALNDKAEIDKLLAVSTLLKICPVMLMALVLQLFGSEIMNFFSPELAAGGTVLVILTLETILLVLCGPSAAFMSLGQGYYMLPIFALVSVATMCALTLLLGPIYGALGAAWAFSSAWGIWAIVGMVYVRLSQGRDISVVSALKWALTAFRRNAG